MVKRDAGPAILLTRSAVTTGVHLAVYGTLILIEAVLGAQFWPVLYPVMNTEWT